MPTLFADADRGRILARLDSLGPERRPLWGSLSATGMVEHVAAALRMGLGELDCAPAPGPLRHWPLNKLVMHVLPWPKGVATSSELLMDHGDWPGACAGLRETLGRFAARGPEGPFADHVAFGRISPSDWGRLMHRHLDHHLRQFGA